MKKSPLLALCTGLLLLTACNNVDKTGTADKLIKDIERIQDITLTPAQQKCVTGVVKSFSDDELRALSKQTASDEVNTTFSTKLQECVTPSTTTTSTTSTSLPADTTPAATTPTQPPGSSEAPPAT